METGSFQLRGDETQGYKAEGDKLEWAREGRPEERQWGGIMNTEGLLKKLHGNQLLWTLSTTYTYVKRVSLGLPYIRVGSTPTRHHMLVNRNPSV